MKYWIIKKDGELKYKQPQELHVTPKIPINCGFIVEGWYVKNVVESFNLSIEGRESREIVDSESYDVVLKENDIVPNNIEILERIIDEITERYYIQEAKTHIEYFVEKNYEVTEEDSESEAYKITNCQQLRAKAYLSIPEQLDMQYWDRVNGTTNWEQHIASVKTMYPKQ